MHDHFQQPPDQRKSDERLKNVLRPIVEGTFMEIINRNNLVEQYKDQIVQSIYPFMMPAVTRAVREGLKSIVDKFNTNMENTFSIQGVKWRVQGWRTGRSFQEIVLLNSLEYWVQEVFLIHKETGLLLQYVSKTDMQADDREMVSGMLTAIQDFVKDSFETSDFDALESFNVGDATILLEHTHNIVLASVVRGDPPPGIIRETLQDAAIQVQSRYANELNHFSGDVAVFEEARPELYKCLAFENFRPESKKEKRKANPLPFLLVVLALLAGGIFWIYKSWEQRTLLAKKRSELLQRLDGEPGIQVISHEINGENFQITCLKDPSAVEPSQIAARITPADFHLLHYYALDAETVRKRAVDALKPPPSVVLTMEQNGILHMVGTAPYTWASAAVLRASFIPGILQVDDKDLQRIGETNEYRKFVRKIERIRLRFKGRQLDGRGEWAKIYSFAFLLEALEEEAARTGKKFSVKILGSVPVSSPKSKTGEDNAMFIRSSVIQQGANAELLKVESFATGDKTLLNTVIFKVLTIP